MLAKEQAPLGRGHYLIYPGEPRLIFLGDGLPPWGARFDLPKQCGHFIRGGGAVSVSDLLIAPRCPGVQRHRSALVPKRGHERSGSAAAGDRVSMTASRLAIPN